MTGKKPNPASVTELGFNFETARGLASKTIDRVLDETAKPRIPGVYLAHVAFEGTAVDERSYLLFNRAVAQSDKLTPYTASVVDVGPEYQIIDRPETFEVDPVEIFSIRERVIMEIQETALGKPIGEGYVVTTAHRLGHFLLNDEFGLLFDLIKQDSRVTLPRQGGFRIHN